jgi:glycosyltransferase involved in cell wall biosynthesis
MAKSKIVVVMPAYNAAKTLRMTYAELLQNLVDMVILVDDGSSDETIRIARELRGNWTRISTRGYSGPQPVVSLAFELVREKSMMA